MLTPNFLNQILHVKIDRPLGSPHPTHGFIYPVNYGYVPDTPAPDGDDLDVYVQYSDDQIEALVEFQERFFKSIIVRSV
jgi:inorganic pyrophosphatase